MGDLYRCKCGFATAMLHRFVKHKDSECIYKKLEKEEFDTIDRWLSP